VQLLWGDVTMDGLACGLGVVHRPNRFSEVVFL
jgi:hypothetical protein